MLCSLGVALGEQVPHIFIRHTIHRHFQQVFKLGVAFNVFIAVRDHLREDRLLCLPSKFQFIVQDFLDIPGTVREDAQFIAHVRQHRSLPLGVKGKTFRVIILNDIINGRIFPQFLVRVEQIHITCALCREEPEQFLQFVGSCFSVHDGCLEVFRCVWIRRMKRHGDIHHRVGGHICILLENGDSAAAGGLVFVTTTRRRRRRRFHQLLQEFLIIIRPRPNREFGDAHLTVSHDFILTFNEILRLLRFR